MDHAYPRRWWRLPAAALAAAALALSSVPAHADADQQPVQDTVPPTSTAVPASSVTGYWTAERMEGAIPADEPDGDHPGYVTGIEPSTPDSAPAADLSEALTVVAEPVPAVDAPEGPRARPVQGYSPTAGKVFFRNQGDGRDYTCSGSAVDSPAKRLVVTAGHCVHGGPGGTWHANWVFAPGYDHGPGPEGEFPATSFRAFDEWITYGVSGQGFNSDVAFVTTDVNGSGERVVDAVGGHGLKTGGSPEFEATLFGYPGNLDAGERMWSCQGMTGTRQIGTFLFPSITGCGFGAGASGGPWLDQYDDASGLGYVRSVTSFGPSDSTAYLGGPYFDQRVAQLYAAADGDSLGG